MNNNSNNEVKNDAKAADELYLKNIVSQMFEQITAAIGPDAMLSWGMSHVTASLYVADDVLRFPCLRFHTNGLLHKGWVMVVYNGTSDLYDVLLVEEDMKTLKKKICGVFCDMLGTVIDANVERDPNLTDAEYYEQANAATIAEGLPPLPPMGTKAKIVSL